VNADLREMLTSRAEGVETPRLDPAAVLARGERLVGQRRRRMACVAACGVALVVAAVLVVVPGPGDRVSPAGPSDPTRTTEPGARPLGYVQGRVLHLGGREVDTGLDALSLDLTDDGAALTTLDGGIWFSDGTGVERIGSVTGGTREADGVGWDDSGRPREWVVSDSEGSLLAWVERAAADDGGGPELVVHDTSRRGVLLREPVPTVRPRDRAVVVAVAGREVFVVRESRGMRSETMVRFSVDGGQAVEVDRETFAAAIRAVPRALLLGPSVRNHVLGTSNGRGGHIVDFHDAIHVRGHRLQDVFDAETGAPLELEMPAGDPVFEVHFLQWLDDDQFALWADGDLVACQIAAGECRRVIDADWSFSDRDDMPLLPGTGGFGSDWALARAMRSTGREG
jgi:hypothetical protein